MSASEELTPLMKQYAELKAQAGDAMLLFRMGDFYELFNDDAITASQILEITLTSRDKNKANPVPMAGVPHHSAQSYIQRLLKAGKKVAIGEQFEEPAPGGKPGKTLVRREITRVFTPAVQFDQEGSEAAYLATVLPASETHWILACLEPSTGETLVSDPLTPEALAHELGAMPIRHFLRVARQLPESALQQLAPASTLIEEIPSNYLSAEQAQETLLKHYVLGNLDAFLKSTAAAHALGILVTYAVRSQKQDRLAHLRLPVPLHQPKTMAFGPRTPQHLDLLPAPDGTPNLYDLINRTRSALGARQFRRWLLEPLKDPAEIHARQIAVQELARDRVLAERLSADFAELYDLERIAGRINTGLANPRDTLALGRSLALLPRLAAKLASAQSVRLQTARQELVDAETALGSLAERILRTQREDAPLVAREGGIFNKGTSEELDRLITLTEDGERWLIELEARERQATGIPTLKVRYNRVFGYYIEVTQANLKNVPAHYQRKQTTVGSERFFTDELKKFEDEIITAAERRKALEQQLFASLLGAARELTPAIMQAARTLGELDTQASLARLALEPGWVFPSIDDSLDLEIVGGRHPLVDSTARGTFVPNDTSLSPATRLSLLITGPNMGGKSTVMRQVALIVILGQMGAPVPAERARWGAVSSLHTRIGAHDAISRGQSTFMVEMSELAHILHNADERSLIVLDEIGRGTSTYDGMSVAWAALEWIATQVRARTLFATHYHELTRLEGVLPCVANAHMAVDGSRGGNLRFLYKLKEGPANESFGVHVARLAGVPGPVIERAWKVLEELEAGGRAHASGQDTGGSQLSLFGGLVAAESNPAPRVIEKVVERVERVIAPHPIIEELGTTDLNRMSPLEALNLLARWQGEVRQ